MKEIVKTRFENIYSAGTRLLTTVPQQLFAVPHKDVFQLILLKEKHKPIGPIVSSCQGV